jgi:hypothetical protein
MQNLLPISGTIVRLHLDNVQSSGFTLQEVPNTKLKENELGDFQEMLERPLFFAGRRPIVLEEGENAETVGIPI